MLRNIFLISLTVSPIIALGLALGGLLRRRYPSARLQLVWLLLAARLLIPFRLKLPQAPVELEILPPSGMAQAAPPEISGAAETALSLWDVLPWVYAAGVAAVLLLHLGSYALFRLRVRWQLSPVEEKRPHEPAVYRCGCIASPVMLGFLHPAILLPQAEYSAEELEAVLTHERAHFRRGDVWCKLLLLLACAVHWFNPLVWLMSRRAAQDLEAACDEAVLRTRGPEYRKIYASAILKSAERSEA